MNKAILSRLAVRQALNVRDLTDPEEGPHAIQLIMDEIVSALQKSYGCAVKTYRESPIVSIADNYDKLRYPAGGAARDARYTRYVCDTALLRTSTSAMVPKAMREAAKDAPDDILLVCPGLVYRRDCIDRIHLAEIHQLDLWRICKARDMQPDDILKMISIIIDAVLPGIKWQVEERVHPYTLNGLQIDGIYDGKLIELGECGLAHPEIVAENMPSIGKRTGLAMGLGLDRILMVRKRMKDVRLVASKNPKVAEQMLDLSPYREVSAMPAVTRDLSVAMAEDILPEEVGDRVREALGEDANIVEDIQIKSETPYKDLPQAARDRIGINEGQKNVLVHIVLRALDRTLTNDECNRYRDLIYSALHEGSVWQWASKA